MSLEFVEELKNIRSLYGKKSSNEMEKVQHGLISEFLNNSDEAIEPLSQVLNDPSSSYPALKLALKMIKTSDDERFVPCLIRFLEKGEDDELSAMAVEIISEYGERAAAHVVKKLEEDFGKKIYNGWLVDALNGAESTEFVERVLNDLLINPTDYEDWFELGHFVWKLDETEERKENSLRLIENLLGLKTLRRVDRLELKRARKFLADVESYEKEMEENDKREGTRMLNLLFTGLLNSKLKDLVPDGPRPVIDDNNLKEYLPLLYSIERLIFGYYCENPSLKDSNVMSALKNIRDKIWEDYEGKDEFEKALLTGLKLDGWRLIDLDYRKGEVSACISRVLNSVKRHKKHEDARSYLEFIKGVFEEEKSRHRPG